MHHAERQADRDRPLGYPVPDAYKVMLQAVRESARLMGWADRQWKGKAMRLLRDEVRLFDCFEWNALLMKNGSRRTPTSMERLPSRTSAMTMMARGVRPANGLSGLIEPGQLGSRPDLGHGPLKG